MKETKKMVFCISLNFLHTGATEHSTTSVKHTMHSLYRAVSGDGGERNTDREAAVPFFSTWCGRWEKAREEAEDIVFSATSLFHKVKVTNLNRVFRNTMVNSIPVDHW